MEQIGSNKLKLMVVDDEPDNLDLLYRTFRRDFQVFRAENGPKALEVLNQMGEMAIIISDQRMPGMNGTELLSRTVEQFPDTIRIVLTGYTDVEDLVEAINAGKVFKYITKPWEPEKLKAVVQQAAETYRVIRQRTDALRRALQRESLFNAMTTAIRGSLDYRSMLQTIAASFGKTFDAEFCVLYPVEGEHSSGNKAIQLNPDLFIYQLQGESGTASGIPMVDPIEPLLQNVIDTNKTQFDGGASPDQGGRIALPLSYQQELLGILVLGAAKDAVGWSHDTINLLESVAEQASLAISQAKLLQRTQKQAQQLQAELAVARQIQSNLLRQDWPQLEEVTVQACCYPAREVGGDFFEVYVHPQGDVWLAVGDVSGKGVPAALFMASAISVLRRELSQEFSPDPEAVMRNLNSSLWDDLMSNNCFITMVLARYTPSTRELIYANAGHIYPLVWCHRAIAGGNGNGHAVEPQYLKTRGVPLGILPVWKAKAGQLTMNVGDVFLLTSDGITEAQYQGEITSDLGNTNHMLRETGLWQLLLQEPNPLSLNNLVNKIRANNDVQEDDQTILALEVL